MPTRKTFLLTSHDIARLVSRVGADVFLDALIQRLTTAVASYDKADFDTPPREGFHYANGLVEWMPLYHRNDSVFMKMVGYHPANPVDQRTPTVVASLSSFDANTGQLTAIADGALLTAMRTGAASAVATSLLAEKDSRNLGLIGCGAQAVTQLHALSRVCSFDTVRVYDTNSAVANSFSERVANVVSDSVYVQQCSLVELVGKSDVICTATSVDRNSGPVFHDVETKPHLNINAVGADLPGKTELPLSLLRKAFVVPDFPAQAVNEGECQRLTRDEIGPSLAEVAAAPLKFQSKQQNLSVFDSTGWALEDFIALELASELASKYQIGSHVAIESETRDPWNPYEDLVWSAGQHICTDAVDKLSTTAAILPTAPKLFQTQPDLM